MYTYYIKNQKLEVIRFTNDDGKTMWRYEVNKGGSDDWYFYKRSAKAAGVEFINKNF